jgi:hypothetical protein
MEVPNQYKHTFTKHLGLCGKDGHGKMVLIFTWQMTNPRAHEIKDFCILRNPGSVESAEAGKEVIIHMRNKPGRRVESPV